MMLTGLLRISSEHLMELHKEFSVSVSSWLAVANGGVKAAVQALHTQLESLSVPCAKVSIGEPA